MVHTPQFENQWFRLYSLSHSLFRSQTGLKSLFFLAISYRQTFKGQMNLTNITLQWLTGLQANLWNSQIAQVRNISYNSMYRNSIHFLSFLTAPPLVCAWHIETQLHHVVVNKTPPCRCSVTTDFGEIFRQITSYRDSFWSWVSE